MSIRTTLLLIPIITLILYSFISARNFDSDTIRIMPWIATTESCLKCHAPDDLNQFSVPAHSCDPNCILCHKTMTSGNHHPVGIKIESTNTVGLGPITQRQKMMCITCHDLRKSRFGGQPWRSQSLYESIFKKKGKYKTFYLVKKNNKGQLCNMCH